MKKLFIINVLLAMAIVAGAREKININQGWKFCKGDMAGAEVGGYNDTKWQTVNLPHDAAVYGEFLNKGENRSSRNGFRPQGQGWYRKTISYRPEWRGKRVVIEFEGVYRLAKVYMNGQVCGEARRNGYVPFEYDITDKLREGENVIAVSYDNRDVRSSRWYNGEGINRSVNLHVSGNVHVARYGTYITTPRILPDRATVAVETQVKNELKDSVMCTLITSILSPSGAVVAERKAVAPFAGGETFAFRQDITVSNPELWNPGDARLYKAVSRISYTKTDGDARPVATPEAEADGDEYTTTFGIRDIEFTPEQGLMVNGRRVYLNGVCLHTDLGPLGTASLDAAWRRRLEAVTRDLGCNALRLSHNCYPHYVLDWADRNGVLIIDEFFDKWEDSYYGQGTKMGKHHLDDIKTQMSRDRNHPSVFLWSVGNEVYQQIEEKKTQGGGVEMLKMLVDFTRAFDPSRKITYSQYPNRYHSVTKKKNAKRFYAAEPNQFEFYTDVVSTNYLENFWDEDHKKYPQLVFMEGEMSVGDLGYDYFNFNKDYPVGQFYWGGTDYIGESFGWPSKGWVRGLVDFTNRLKPLGYSVKSFYTSEPMVKLVTRPDKGQGSLVWNDLKMTWLQLEQQWNYKGVDSMKVQVMTNCRETELLLNGRSLGRKRLPPADKAPELTWMVPYAAGELKAVGYNGSGAKVAEDILRTAGRPARIMVDCDAAKLKADGMDLSYLNYTVVDKDGNPCVEDVKLTFSVTGQGTNAGVATADMLSSEPWQADSRTTYMGRAQLIVRSACKPGQIKVTAKAKGLKAVTTVITVE